MTEKKRRLFLNVYGLPKTGKSELARTAPGPKFIIDVEGRAHTDEGDHRERVFGNTDMTKALRSLQRDQHDFKTVVWDSTTALGDNLIDDITGGSKPEWDHWGVLKRQVTRYGRQLRDIMDTTPIEVVYLITSARQWSNPDDPKDKRVILDLDGAFRQKVMFMVDATFYMESNVSRSGAVTYNLVTGPKKGLVTAHTNFGPNFPSEIENPTMDKILDSIDYDVFGS